MMYRLLTLAILPLLPLNLNGCTEDATASAPPAVKDVYNVVIDGGAIGDGVTDDTQAIQKTIDMALDASTSVYVPRGTYRITAPIIIAPKTYSAEKAIRIEGEWATIRADKEDMNAVVEIFEASFFTMKRLILDANDKAHHGLEAFKLSGASALIEQVTVMGAVSHGFLLQACQAATFRNAYAYANGGDGFKMQGCNGSNFNAITSMSNAGHGISMEGYLYNDEKYSGGCFLSGFDTEKNNGNGVHIGIGNISALEDGETQPTGFSVRDGWIEGNDGDGIEVAAPNSLISGMRIVSNKMPGTRAIRLQNTALGAVVRGVRAANNSVDDYVTIRAHLSSSYNTPYYFDIGGNYNMYSVAPMNTEFDSE